MRLERKSRSFVPDVPRFSCDHTLFFARPSVRRSRNQSFGLDNGNRTRVRNRIFARAIMAAACSFVPFESAGKRFDDHVRANRRIPESRVPGEPAVAECPLNFFGVGGSTRVYKAQGDSYGMPTRTREIETK